MVEDNLMSSCSSFYPIKERMYQTITNINTCTPMKAPNLTMSQINECKEGIDPEMTTCKEFTFSSGAKNCKKCMNSEKAKLVS